MKTALKIAFVLGVSVPAASYAANERRAVVDAKREMDAIANVAQTVTGAAHVVHMNGAELYFDKHTEDGSVADVMARVAHECAAGDLGVPRERELTADFQRVVSEEAENGTRASLCIFEGHRVRWTMAFPREDGSVAVTTVVNASSTPIEQLFPVEGDAPGSDLAEIARPKEARRTATIIVGKGEHSVRVYESTLSVEESVGTYDTQMKARGFETTGALEDARMYRKDGRSWAASFRATTAGSTVALMPFDPR